MSRLRRPNSRNGGPEELRYEEVEVGEPGPRLASGTPPSVSIFTDIHHRTGRYPVSQFPHVIGMEATGGRGGRRGDERSPSRRSGGLRVGKPRAYSQATVMPITRLKNCQISSTMRRLRR